MSRIFSVCTEDDELIVVPDSVAVEMSLTDGQYVTQEQIDQIIKRTSAIIASGST
jgi:hypothetical protein